MLALTIRQPRAWAIVAGLKTVENRGWKTAVRGRIFVHAGRLDQPDALDSFAGICERLNIIPPSIETLPARAIIGSVDIVDCVPVETIRDPWATGPWCFILRDSRSRQPTPERRLPRFWRAKVDLN
jgi:activating signal cointegrator 1